MTRKTHKKKAQSVKDKYICIECGQSQAMIIKKLQDTNYCLEECKTCHKTVDKFVEYEELLKLLSVILCKK